MKIEIWGNFPEYFKPLYPEEFKLFSHFEKTAGVPTVFLQLLPIKKMENREVVNPKVGVSVLSVMPVILSRTGIL